MSDPIIIQLQKLAIDSSSNVEEVVRLALIAATKLKLKDFKKWCKNELEGYNDKKIPAYRKTRATLKAFNPLRGNIPFFITDPDMQDAVTYYEIRQPLSNLISLLNGKSNSFEIQMPNEWISILMKMQEETGTFSPLMPKLLLTSSHFQNVVDSVRQEVLNWSLELESQGILGEDFNFTKTEKQTAEKMTSNTFNIQNMQGVVGSVNGGTINQNNQMNIKENDFNSLAKYLMENKVEFSDIQSLQSAIDQDPIPTTPSKFGANVSSWLANMMGKAASGSWEIGIATAGTLLAESLAKFYGLS
ncbi:MULTISPECIES: AbiTii domain-containing protein [Acinetobacter]|uniref:AbiTii domain-containing protein n=1 Tax=Acinetobacter TaxID=469 RepID=UPI0005AA4595|nr:MULTISPECIES: hypothetical protein [Acinetobacter]QOX00297.1 hypothetical protein IOD65_06585 [Acinetobacter sp. Ac-14]